jgi:ribosomal protein S12 methylthiotransferase accessory factor
MSSGNSKDDVYRCVDILRKNGLEVIVVDITTDDIKETPFKVVKVLIPGLQQLNGDHNYPFLGGHRLKEAPKKMGYAVKEGEYNKLPHPFP